MLTEELEMLSSTRSRTLAIVAGLSQEQMDYSPAPGKWSIGELLDHLLLSEGITRNDIAELIDMARAGREPDLSRSTDDFDVAPFFIPKPLLPFAQEPFAFLSLFFPNRMRELLLRYVIVPARAASAASPVKGRPADELREALVSSLKETEALFATNPDLDYGRMIHRHPLLGVQNVRQLLRNLALHERRHQDQIAGVLRRALLPRAA
jgi:uncharacterized damage-inducible protein DinB